MGIVFCGLMFLMLEMNVQLSNGDVVIGLLPDVVGLVLLLFGLRKLKSNSRYFSRAMTFGAGLIPAAAIHFGMGIMGASEAYIIVYILLGLLCVVGRLLVALWITQGIRDMEAKDEVELHGTQLWWMWLCYVLLSVVIFPVELIAGVVPLLGSICELAGLILGLCFMVFFHRTMRAFDEIYEFQ